MSVKNKVAIVTGGASGIGFCYAVELLKNGLRAVTLADADSSKGHEALTQLSKDFGDNKVLFLKTDVTDQEQLKNAFQKTVDLFGNVDILINNAGIMNDAIWEKEIAINMNGTIYGCLLGMEEYFPKYKSGEEGLIINVSSIAGLTEYPAFPVYVGTKHAIIGLSRSFGTPEQYDTCKVKVLTICPGITETPLMSELDRKMINDRYLGILKIGYEARLTVSQSSDDVAKGLIKIIEEGSNGSVWVVEGAEAYELEFPNRQQLRRK